MHLWIAEGRLRDAIKETVAEAGCPLVRLDPFERALHRAAEQIAAENGLMS
jgi:hypothetical protein